MSLSLLFNVWFLLSTYKSTSDYSFSSFICCFMSFICLFTMFFISLELSYLNILLWFFTCKTKVTQKNDKKSSIIKIPTQSEPNKNGSQISASFKYLGVLFLLSTGFLFLVCCCSINLNYQGGHKKLMYFVKGIPNYFCDVISSLV